MSVQRNPTIIQKIAQYSQVIISTPNILYQETSQFSFKAQLLSLKKMSCQQIHVSIIVIIKT